MAGRDASRELVQLGLSMIKHRGPDHCDIWQDKNVILGHSRLAIVDLNPRSNQPMVEGKHVLVYNGELWNYEEIRRELSSMGVEFRTTSDTEVVLRSWIEWGPECMRRFDGMFALAMWDGRKLWLAKDRWGKLPLSFSASPMMGTISFASERKALKFGLQIPDQAIDEVPPGCYVSWSPEGVGYMQYWRLELKPCKDSSRKAADVIANHLWKGVEQRMMSDVPLCTLMSGGLYSGIITYLVKKMAGSVTAFTAVHDEKSDDLRFARDTADLLGIDLVEVPVPLPDTEEGIRKVMKGAIFMSEMSFKAQVEISVACRELAVAIRSRGFKVVFSGEGSDETWGSYKAVRLLAKKPAEWQQARENQVIGQWRKNFPRCNKIFMTEGIECRLPFLHEPLVRYGLSLPFEVVDGGQYKRILRQAAVILGVPEKIANRPRMAFQTAMGLSDRIAHFLGDSAKEYRRMEVEVFGTNGVRDSSEFNHRTGEYHFRWSDKRRKRAVQALSDE